ncbi:hypothetical protein [Streptomyces sp. NPDC059604]|uniref:hypothetical protein n=1 Tax=Streptomyces sp. NPDC059604 TaxID=3346881 RepID=UPI00367365C6
MVVKPTKFTPPPGDDDIVVTRETVGSKPRPKPKPAVAEAPEMTRRSWYTRTEAVDALAAAVDDIHHNTRIPKHEVVAALMEAAVAQAPKVEAKLRRAAGLK